MTKRNGEVKKHSSRRNIVRRVFDPVEDISLQTGKRNRNTSDKDFPNHQREQTGYGGYSLEVEFFFRKLTEILAGITG
jgi:hypothetical protein